MAYIIGREKEKRGLESLYDSDKAEFVAVYGRRRVGKTFLIDEALILYMIYRCLVVVLSGYFRYFYSICTVFLRYFYGTSTVVLRLYTVILP